MRPYCQTFSIACARLFDVNIHVSQSIYDPDRLVLAPASIRICNENIPIAQDLGNLLDAGDVRIRIPSNFKLKLSISFTPIRRHFTRHFGWVFLGDRSIEWKGFAIAATEQRDDGQTGKFAQNIPTCDVDCGFHIRVSTQAEIHSIIDNG